MREFSGSCMSRAERGDADADEESGVVSVQAALLHDAIGDIARRLTAIESIAYLMTGNDRGLSGCERDPLGLQRIQEIGVHGIGARAGCGYRHHTERGEHQG
jgi:hypothetical protein